MSGHGAPHRMRARWRSHSAATAQENVAVALTFLGYDVKSTTADEIVAAWNLLDIQEGTAGELEEYLRSASRRG